MRLSALSVISLPSSSRNTARRPRGVVYSRSAGTGTTERGAGFSAVSHHRAPAPTATNIAAAHPIRFHVADAGLLVDRTGIPTLGVRGAPSRDTSSAHPASTSYGAPSRRASAAQAARSASTAPRRSGAAPIHASTAARSSVDAVPPR